MSEEAKYHYDKSKFMIPIYGIRVDVYLVSHMLIADNILEELGYEKTSDRDLAITVFKAGKVSLIFKKGSITHPVMHHEIEHVVHDIWKYLGVTMTHESHECHTYLSQYIHEKLAALLIRKGETLKHT